jgi:putative membrane protein
MSCMSDARWLSPSLRDRVAATVRQIEGRTGAEVVVTVRARSGCYRAADYLFGACCSLAALLGYVFLPITFPDDVAALLIVLSFGVGAVFAANVPPLRRLFVSRSRRGEEVARAARACFVDQGIGQTRDRTGVLVFLSLFERRVEVVADRGIPVARLGQRYRDATAALDRAARRGPEAFLAALGALGELLAESVPRRADDVNELPDEVVSE